MTRPRATLIANGGRERRDVALQRRRLPVPREELANERGGDGLERRRRRKRRRTGAETIKCSCPSGRIVPLVAGSATRGSPPSPCPLPSPSPRVLSRLARTKYTVLTPGARLYWTDAQLCEGAARLVARARLICPLRRVRASLESSSATWVRIKPFDYLLQI